MSEIPVHKHEFQQETVWKIHGRYYEKRETQFEPEDTDETLVLDQKAR